MTSPAAAEGGSGDPVQVALDALVKNHDLPGAQVVLEVPGKPARILNAGVGDLETGAPFPKPSAGRIGSITKTFIATVVLQLVAEGKVKLDDPVETYLPGVLRGNNIDGRLITVRHLLRHQSGLPEHSDDLWELGIDNLRYRHFTAEELLALALDETGAAPGGEFVYNNTNYIVAGMLIGKVTGKNWRDAVTERIVKPLNLSNTDAPKADEYEIRGANARGYHLLYQGEGKPPKRIEYTAQSPSAADSAGGMTANGIDLNRFMDKLVNGNLLPPAQLAEMKKTVPSGEGEQYGLGLEHHDKSNACAKEWWGHGGSIPAWVSQTGVTADGRRVTLLLNQGFYLQEMAEDFYRVFNSALCPS
ncbi:serine hydrolase domain-containing protein [Amycolatopsis anabasis]|uniref:serine hydrolase domain-containing protein n=1 Tax=Amycolatopsis anabasis TaxID=1840409 RepID=UPI001C55103F|nr:serine hydrolase domain-containing protein [Amycolatopsis anabasis]